MTALTLVSYDSCPAVGRTLPQSAIVLRIESNRARARSIRPYFAAAPFSLVDVDVRDIDVRAGATQFSMLSSVL
jgi:hypothetical protein